jgi:transposase
MEKCIIAGIDLHDENMLLKTGVGKGPVELLNYSNDRDGRKAMLREFRKRRKACGASRVVFAYEASGAGFGLHDDIVEAGFECHVLAPNKMPRSQKQRRQRNDERDALMILEHLRGHLLAGNELHAVWIPDAATRDDREVVRARIDAAGKAAKLKSQMQNLLKRHDLRRPRGLGKGWTDKFIAWLHMISSDGSGPLGTGGRLALQAYLRQLAAMEQEVALLDDAVEQLAATERYRAQVHALVSEHKGVGTHVAMVFLSEMGDLTRFSNRRQVGAYLGLVPTSDESGQDNDHKGHITHQGSWRTSRALCQAAWARSRTDDREKRVYERIVKRNPKHKKIAVVALMRRLGISMWHTALPVQPDLERLRAEAETRTAGSRRRRPLTRGGGTTSARKRRTA